MARIKIKDLPRDRKISKEEMKRIQGGISSEPVYFQPKLYGRGFYQPSLLNPGMIIGNFPLPTP